MVYTSFYSLFFLVLFPFHTFAQNNSNIAAGSTLTATDSTNPWLSPSGDFAFGFSQTHGTNQFLLCIWYAKIDERTIVWHANTTSPVPQGSTLRLDAELGLILRDPQGNRLWITDGLVDKVDHGFLNDTGMFVLVGSDSTVLWDTFAHPTDTLLPTQEMEIGTMLISRRSEGNFSLGRFYLRMLDSGNLVLSSKMVSTNSDYDAEYYNSQTSDLNQTNSGYKVIFSEKGSISVLKRNNATEELTPRAVSSVMENYLRLTLNFDGVLTLYRYPKASGGNQSWTPLWFEPDNICTKITGDKGSGACGYNSVCSIDANQRPSCDCPRGYSLIDPSDKYGSCKPNYVQTCGKGSSEEVFSLIEITDTDWPLSDFEQINPSNRDDCKTACLNDCLCAVAIFRSNSCWKKKLPLSNGRIDTNLDSTAFLKVGKDDAPPLSPDDPWRGFPERKSDRGNLILVGSVLLGSSVFVNILLLTAVLFGFFFIYKKKIKAFAPTNTCVPSNLHFFSYQCLVQATNQFKEEIGRGAYGIAYKGEMPVGSGNIVAVKKLDRVAHDIDKEFKTEVNVIGQTHHKNLVRLLGYCDEGQHRLLVYEYMSNGTLANYLFDNLKPSWSERTKVALGVAHGLTYLHEECSTQIIHCDIKPQNILLDDYYTARISDFGLAKLLMMNQSRTYTDIRGTKGYVAPEWFRNNQVTVKVDVYSFGVLLMEIIACRRSLEDEEICGPDKVVLADWFADCFQEKRLELLVEDDEEALRDMEKLERFVMTAIWCIQEDASLRPTMRKVCQMLGGVVEVPEPPFPYPVTSMVSSLH